MPRRHPMATSARTTRRACFLCAPSNRFGNTNKDLSLYYAMHYRDPPQTCFSPALLNQLFARDWVTLHGLVVMLGLVVYATASHTLRQRRHPSAAIAWVISLILLPYAALPLYLMIGSRKLAGSRRAENTLASPHRVGHGAPTAHKSWSLASAIGLADAATFERLTIHQDGAQARKSLLSMIDGATRTLDLCSFLVGRDALGDEIMELLVRRAREGLRIRLLIDGIGFYVGGYPNLKPLSSAGVHVALFVSPLRSGLRGRTNLRNHRKLVVADGNWMWCGGRNLSAEYFEGDQTSLRKKPAWIDLSFDLHGALAQQAQQQFDRDWIFALTGSHANAPPLATGTPSATAARPATAMLARLVPSGPDQADDTLYTLLVSGCFTAHSRILAVSPYFVPDATLLMALTLAARRGIAVDLLLPNKSNHRLADVARHAALRELAEAGARVWLAPVMIHAKAVLIDDELALVGSANLDERSLFLNYELMVAFYDPSVVRSFGQWVERQRGSATFYRPPPTSLARALVEGAVRWVAFQL